MITENTQVNIVDGPYKGESGRVDKIYPPRDNCGSPLRYRIRLHNNVLYKVLASYVKKSCSGNNSKVPSQVVAQTDMYSGSLITDRFITKDKVYNVQYDVTARKLFIIDDQKHLNYLCSFGSGIFKDGDSE